MTPAWRVVLAAGALVALGGCTYPGTPAGPSPSSVAPTTSPSVSSPPAGAAVVVRVVDGDTLVVQRSGVEVTVRALAFDTPETVKPGTAVQCGGPQASARAKALAPVGASVTLTPDPTQGAHDRYGRELDYVGVQGGFPDLGLVLVTEGLAHAYKLASGKAPQRYGAYLIAQHDAEAAHRGPLWDGTCPIN